MTLASGTRFLRSVLQLVSRQELRIELPLLLYLSCCSTYPSDLSLLPTSSHLSNTLPVLFVKIVFQFNQKLPSSTLERPHPSF